MSMVSLQEGFLVLSRVMEKDSLKGFLLVHSSGRLIIADIAKINLAGYTIPYKNAEYDGQYKTLVGNKGTSLTKYPSITKDMILTSKDGIIVLATILDANTRKPIGVVAYNGMGGKYNLTYKKLSELSKRYSCCNFDIVNDKTYGLIAVQKDGSYFETIEMSVPDTNNTSTSSNIQVPVIQNSNSDIPVVQVYSMDFIKDSEFSQPCQEKFVKAMLNMQALTPYYSTVLQAIRRVPAPNLGTMGVTEDTLLYDLSFVANLQVPELTFVLIHEIMHIAMQHSIRFGNRQDHDLWNIACDLYINSIICKDFGCTFGGEAVNIGTREKPVSIKTPQFGVFIETIGEKIDLAIDTPESIYNKLLKENKGSSRSNSINQSTNKNGSLSKQLVQQGIKNIQNGANRAQNQINQSGNTQSRQQSQQAQQQIKQGIQNIQQGMQNNNQQQIQQGLQQVQQGIHNMNNALQQSGQQGQQNGQQGSQSGAQSGQGNMGDQSSQQGDMSGQGSGQGQQGNSGSEASVQMDVGNQQLQSGLNNQNGQSPDSSQLGTQVDSDQPTEGDLSEDSNSGENGSGIKEVNVTYNGKKLKGSIMKDVMSNREAKNNDDVKSSIEDSKRALQKIDTKIKLEEQELGQELVKNAGAGGGLVQRYIEFGLSSGVDWRVLLRNMCKDKPKKTFTLAQPNQDYMNMGMTLADRRPIGKPTHIAHVKFAVDVSGSVSQRELSVILSEINNIYNFFKVDGELIYWSTMVGNAGMFSSMKDMLKIEPISDGGTDVKCVFEYLCGETKVNKKSEPDKVKDIKAVFILTDGCFSHNYSKYAQYFGKKVIWLITGVKGNPITFDPPFGRVIGLDI